jgi:hypothetical protein
MARTAFALAVFAMMVAAAVAQTPFTYEEVTNATHHYSFTQTTSLSSTADWSIWQYAHVNVPQNAYLVYFNVSNPSCSYTYVYSLGTLTQAIAVSFEYVASQTMPCSAVYAATSSSSTHYYMCNPSQSFSTSYNDNNQFETSVAMGDSTTSGYQTFGVVNSIARSPASGSTGDAYYVNSNSQYSTGSYVAVRPNSDMWLGLGFYSNLASSSSSSSYTYTYSCDVDINAVAYQCPIGQVAIRTNYQLSDIQGVCVTQQNITVVSDTFQTITYAATDAQQSVIQLNNIPPNASAVVINVTIPYSVSGTPQSSAGSELVAPDAYVNSYYGSAYDCGLNSGVYEGDGNVYIYTYVCFAPKWNSSFYIATDVTKASSSAIAWSVSAMVMTCPAGWTGAACSDPIAAAPVIGDGATTTTSISFAAPATGYAHFYFDVPANNWNNTLIGFTATVSTSQYTGTTYLYLRRDAYSNTYDSDGIRLMTPFNGYNQGYYNYANYRESGSFYVDGTGTTSTLVSSPFERFNTYRSTRWVLTVACPGAGNSFPGDGYDYSCSGSVAVTFPTASVDLPTGSGGPSDANVLAPLSALLIALVALFLF